MMKITPLSYRRPDPGSAYPLSCGRSKHAARPTRWCLAMKCPPAPPSEANHTTTRGRRTGPIGKSQAVPPPWRSDRRVEGIGPEHLPARSGRGPQELSRFCIARQVAWRELKRKTAPPVRPWTNRHANTSRRRSAAGIQQLTRPRQHLSARLGGLWRRCGRARTAALSGHHRRRRRRHRRGRHPARGSLPDERDRQQRDHPGKLQHETPRQGSDSDYDTTAAIRNQRTSCPGAVPARTAPSPFPRPAMFVGVDARRLGDAGTRARAGNVSSPSRRGGAPRGAAPRSP